MSKTTNKFSPEVRERVVRLVLDNEGQHGSRWQAVLSIAAKIGCVPQVKLPKRLDLARDAERAADGVPGLIVANWAGADMMQGALPWTRSAYRLAGRARCRASRRTATMKTPTEPITSLGTEQPLLNPELLGSGRDPSTPVKDEVTADGVRGRGAAVTNLSHSASFHSIERIASSNRGIKHLATQSKK